MEDKTTKWEVKSDEYFEWYECPDCGFKHRLTKKGVELKGIELPKLCPNCFPESRRIKVGDVVHDETENRNFVVVEVKKYGDRQSSDDTLRVKDGVEYAYSIDLETGEQISSNVLSLETAYVRTAEHVRTIEDLYEDNAYSPRYKVIGQSSSAVENYIKAKKLLIASAKVAVNEFNGRVV